VPAAQADDLEQINCFGHLLEDNPTLRVGILRVEDAFDSGCHIFVTRVVEPIRHLTRGEKIVFVESSAKPDPASRILSFRRGDEPPKMAAGQEYLAFFLTHGDRDLDHHVRALGWKDPIAYATSSDLISSQERNIRAVLHDIREYIQATDLPKQEKPAALRRWIFAHLDTKHDVLRRMVRRDLAVHSNVYPGATKEEATRLAQYSDVVGGYERFSILRNLALLTDHPMDFWYIRALSQGAPGKIDPYDTASGMAFHDSLLDAAPKLSIDSFWPLLERPTRSLSPWVEAFAKKADPRLLPIILRHLEPGRAENEAVDALEHYKGKPEAARAVIDLIRRTNNLGNDRWAQRYAQDALLLIGTPDAIAEAGRLREAKKLPVETGPRSHRRGGYWAPDPHRR
jgi:hypothetical protein